MIYRIFIGVVLGFFMTGCSTLSQMTVKQYKAKTGEKVLAGQAQPKAEYNCAKMTEEKADYWRKEAFSLSGGDNEKLTTTGVDNAPKNKSNYVYLDMPTSVNGWNTSAPTLHYYSCKNLPDLTPK